MVHQDGQPGLWAGPKARDRRIQIIDSTQRLHHDGGVSQIVAPDALRAAGQPVPEQKYILELNPDHALVKKLDTIEDEALFGEWVSLLHEQAQLAEQGGLNDPASFVSRINRLLLQA